MIRKLITLFKLGRKIAQSDILSIASKFKKPPLALTILFKILSFSFQKKEEHNLDKDEGNRLSRSLESMGTTFIKLGQFLATRPDIIGEELSKKLENLQDRLPPFSINNSLYSSSISYNVSKLSAVKAGDRTSIFSMPLLGKLSRTSSVKGSSQFFVNLD